MALPTIHLLSVYSPAQAAKSNVLHASICIIILVFISLAYILNLLMAFL